MVRAHEHGHERSRTRPRLDHTPIKALPIGPLPGLNVPNFNRVATLRRFVIVARGPDADPPLEHPTSRVLLGDQATARSHAVPQERLEYLSHRASDVAPPQEPDVRAERPVRHEDDTPTAGIRQSVDDITRDADLAHTDTLRHARTNQ